MGSILSKLSSSKEQSDHNVASDPKKEREEEEPRFHGFASSEIEAQSEHVKSMIGLRRDLAAFDLDSAHGVVKRGMATLNPKMDR